jgi:hypothetical protein
MRTPKLLLVIFALIMFIPQPAIVLSADIVTVSGYVNDTGGKPISNVVVTAFEEGNVVANTNTDNQGRYTVSVPRPKRIEPPAIPRFFKGRPVYEAVDFSVGYPVVEGQWTVVDDISTVIDTEGKSSIRKDFVLEPAGVLKLRAYRTDGTQITTFDVPGGISQYSEDPVWPAYTTDLDWRVIPSTLVRDHMLFLVPINTTVVLNLPWEVPGFGRVVLRADNGGEGFRFKERGETTSINLNYEFARTESRLLIESYRRYLGAGYRFTDDLPMWIQTVRDLLRMVTDATADAQKARLAYPCINSTL